MSEADKMEGNAHNTNGDGFSAKEAPYFYRLRNSEDQHHFQTSMNGIKCPICQKEHFGTF